MSEGVEVQPIVAVCKWFNVSKGFGFLQLPGGGLDVFVHANQLRKSGIARPLIEGEKVYCCVEMGPKGQYATSIVIFSPSSEQL